ncbi:hypothetical protein [Pseudaestuariivita atlantica]|uniref:Cobalamin biosynthesis protein CobQ n=1 Tax=Pseudaestuariivita atlantica TaxID=1317121 RepID=A0A0L1JLV3_9RHOB|nr:hypothetical protein [Pseudaestuariivita atlantica]KNG92731.1 cobalamin biosynthesis protein CobQ [Pseudaestuariivita atlantica]
MNTPAHLIFGIAAFGKPDRPATLWAATLGALAPDLSLYLMGAVSLYLLRIPPNVVFGELYYSDAWQTVFAIDNSAILWGGLLAWALWRRHAVLTAFAGAGLLHIALDFPLHHDDGRAHFWPLTNWIFESPVSYWDARRHAGIVGPIEGAASLILGLWAGWRIRHWGWRAALAILLFLQLGITSIWFRMLF